MRSSILISLALASYVSAHGWVQSITVGGQTYDGNEPTENAGGSTKDSVIRQISTVDPVKGADNKNLGCGQDAKPAALQADANPGDKVKVQWTSSEGHWFHNVGPMITYMASCGSSDCSDFDSSDAKWFKIDNAGADDSGTWAQAKLDDGSPATVTIPEDLEAGNYLLQHTIIALQGATSEGGAEFYPSCAQLKVGGSGTKTPKDSELVSIPGVYSDDDKGLLVDVYTNFIASDYQFPGGDVVSLATGGSDSGSSGSSSGSTNNGSSGSSSGSSSSADSSSSSASATESSSATDAPAPSSTASTGSGAGSGADDSSSASAPSSTASTGSGAGAGDSSSASSAPAATSSSGACRKRGGLTKKRSPAANNATVEAEIKREYVRAEAELNAKNVRAYKPRHISRVMRGIAGAGSTF